MTRLPDPALVVLVGPSGAGKSTWAASRYRAQEIVSSDALRGVVGSGPNDLDASVDAFALLESIVDARLGRGLTTVVDTLGLDSERRRRWLEVASRSGLATVAVLFDTPAEECRRRNATRDRPVPARVLADQIKRHRGIRPDIEAEGWGLVTGIDQESAAPASVIEAGGLEPDRRGSHGLRVFLQVSRFPWGSDPLAWLREVAVAADEAGFAGLAVMDHLIQIPQVGRAWDPIPEPWVALGALAALDTGLQLGTLCTPVTFRPPGITAKAAATLSALTGGRTFLGVGAGWWAREHAAFGLSFPGPRERLDELERGIVTMKALFAPGTKAFTGDGVELPETTCYPRPGGAIPIIVGGNGNRTLEIAARHGDACNLTTSDPDRVQERLAVLRRYGDLPVTVLDTTIVGRDRDDVWARVEKHRGRTAAAAFAKRSNAGTVDEHRHRFAELAELGVSEVFVATPDLDGAEAVADLARLNG